jgi:outer membrane protein TolC
MARISQAAAAAAAILLSCSFGWAAEPEVLSLDDAVRLALDHNRAVAKSALSANALDAQIAAAKTYRLPSFKMSTTTGFLLTQPTLTFEKGAFGSYPGIGPIPGTDTEITSARKPTALIELETALPLTQQRRIGLGIRLLEIGKKIAREQVRLTQQEMVKQVRQTYYSILQSQTSLEAVEQSLSFLRELSTETTRYVKAGTALEADMLGIRARLKQVEYEKAAIEGPLASAKEQLNHLLGRALDYDFRLSAAIEADWMPELVNAREKAVTSRPEVQQARLEIERAVTDRKKKKTEFTPDVSLTVTYYSAINIAPSLPRNVAIAGVHVEWEPFDWGRKRNELLDKDNTIRQAELAAKDVEDKVRMEVGTAYRKMNEARLMLAASRAAQESAREMARITAVRFRVDAALVQNVLSAEADLASANDKTQKALLAYWYARAELEKAMGEEI